MNLFLAGLGFLSIFGIGEALYRFAKVPVEWTRKLQHLLSGLFACAFPWIFSSPWEVFLLGAVMAPVLFVLRRFKALSSLHDVKRESLGEFYFLISIAALFYLSFDSPPIFYLIPLLLLTVCDSLAAIVGSAYRKFTYGHAKSFEGSAAFLISAFLVVLLPLLLFDFDPILSIWIALKISLILTLIEAVSSKGIDNLLIPLASYGLLLYLTSFSPSYLDWTAISLLFLATVFYFRRISIDEFAPANEKIAIFDRFGKSDPIHPDALCLAAMRGSVALAVLTLQKKGDLGLIGHYEAACSKAGIALLRAARKKLKQLGVKQAIGPINGSTWNRYRLAMDDKNPFFLGEPKNPPSYCAHFLKTGFTILESYESRIATDLLERKDAYARLDARMKKLGLSIEPLNLEHFEKTLQEIYAMSLSAFAENPFYEPVDFNAFCSRYRALKPLLKPEFVQLAYDRDRRLIGYALAYEDPQNRSQIIFKTLAADKKARAAGLGVYLFDKIHHLAALTGKQAVIHALMHEKHNSLKLSKSMKTAHFRDYGIYSCNL